MSRIAYVNGRYLAHREASVSIDDRGYQFADGVYEVIAVAGGVFIDASEHFDRLTRSLAELDIAWPVPRNVLEMIARRVVAMNKVEHGMLYLQVTRGVARRAHDFPVAAQPQLIMTARGLKPISQARLESGISVITVPDQRWARRDIKSIALLPNILAKRRAREQDADEAWQVASDGTITEGTTSNAWIVTAAGEVQTRPADHDILNGVTRLAVLEAARDLDLTVVERSFTVADAHAAREAFITSTTQFVMPVVKIDQLPVGSGDPGPVTAAVLAELRTRIAAQCRKS